MEQLITNMHVSDIKTFNTNNASTIPLKSIPTRAPEIKNARVIAVLDRYDNNIQSFNNFNEEIRKDGVKSIDLDQVDNLIATLEDEMEEIVKILECEGLNTTESKALINCMEVYSKILKTLYSIKKAIQKIRLINVEKKIQSISINDMFDNKKMMIDLRC